MRYYELDFVLLTDDGLHYIVETKGLVVGLATAFTVPAFGGNTETKEQCQKDGGTWDANTKHCSGKY